MVQSYKIFINEVPVNIMSGPLPLGNTTTDDKNPVYSFAQKKEIDKAFNIIENSSVLKSLTIYGDDAKEIRDSLFIGYKKIKAAGGLVFNNKDEILMIFRRNMWDLPKGKLDVGERKKVAALREVREETGLQKLSIVKKLMKTYHTYLLENKTKVLKVTHWYLMMCNDTTTPVPQAEEDIEIAKWIDSNNVKDKLDKAYANIRLVVDTGISTMHHG
ncbi:MAG: NUDIX domain-containing protein [Chitinophagales bacterium]|nr:NUDIX domain-containing protein [Bacteroidota bacterium]MBK7568398.1 NUDIX domain-containing protein [Bacteroidota bacterium]MBP9220173.1 NUDIX domain-containing protein [Chitinophagales bacterium]MBP9795784.1 NUDIX domain-containing protein [Chitinophagales bacterium]